MATLEQLGAEKYILLTTFRKDGTAVPTPVWVVPDGSGLAVWTAGQTAKVKRVRNNGRVTIAASDVRGNPRGEAVEAAARIGDEADLARVRRELRRKYGLQGWIGLLSSKIRRNPHGTVAILIYSGNE